MIRQIKCSDTYDLRHKILRPSQPLSACSYNYDDHQEAVHLGWFVNKTLQGICTALPENQNGDCSTREYRLRGMAVDASLQGKGIGGKLIQELAKRLIAKGAPKVLWCNVRASAVAFYEKSGFEVDRAVFDIPGIGPHQYAQYHL